MTYKETIEFMYSQLPAYHRIGKAAYKNDLANTLVLDEYFGHPHSKYRTIHVGGTNGKGSVSHLTASVLQQAGFKTGLYTSPHLKDFRERIKVNGRMITKREVTGFLRKHREIIESVKPSFFEMTVAMAFDYFARLEVDFAVIEVGLGGRLDSTNIISPVVSVITNIGHDHMDILGNTFEKIAIEKAGIIKNGTVAVIGETQPETKDVFLRKAKETASDIWFADNEFRCALGDEISVKGERHFTIRSSLQTSEIKGIIPLGGDYQQKNLQTLFQIFSSIEGQVNIREETIIKGIHNVIQNTGLMGRWQILNRHPLTICDTGHNREGLEYVIRQLKRIPAPNLHIVLGFVADKELDQVLPLFPKHAIYYFTRASILRALDEEVLLEKASEYGLTGTCYPSVRKALLAATRLAEPSDLIFIGGSTFIVAEII